MSAENVQDLGSLDDLFDNLRKEIASVNQDEVVDLENSEFERIKKSVQKIPKLSSGLDSKEFQEKSKTVKKVEVLYDPIVVKQKKSGEQETAGKEWFNMPKTEVTKQVKNDLLVLAKRDVLDPKRHYKKQKWVQPEFFQIGEIVNDHYSKNMSRKQKGSSIINELLVDDDTKKYFKRRYDEIQQTKTSGRRSDYKKLQKMRRKF